jgi:hypothetical protein
LAKATIKPFKLARIAIFKVIASSKLFTIREVMPILILIRSVVTLITQCFTSEPKLASNKQVAIIGKLSTKAGPLFMIAKVAAMIKGKFTAKAKIFSIKAYLLMVNLSPS